MLAHIPDLGCKDIIAGLQKWGQVHSFKIPVIEVTPGRAIADRAVIDHQPVPVVTADMHDEVIGPALQVDDLAEMIYAICPLWNIRTSDPTGGPLALQKGRIYGDLSRAGEGGYK